MTSKKIPKKYRNDETFVRLGGIVSEPQFCRNARFDAIKYSNAIGLVT
ncbi:hypothetical protein TUM4445_05820 [Shewanella sp. MBTL60-112-B2]|nr:hypothetical protein TUM4444_04840 [Shewanella sp. MBTL60-112-B1]GIU26545.1 hypothetical protein TUM4445_05820 [Shewanella sp. MBTL60-112-B2]